MYSGCLYHVFSLVLFLFAETNHLPCVLTFDAVLLHLLSACAQLDEVP
jgi:hypothetical protein